MNINSLILFKIFKNGSLNITQIPINLAIRLPGQDGMYALSESFNLGGVNLIRDITQKLLSSKDDEISRYIIFPLNSLENIFRLIKSPLIEGENIYLKDELITKNTNQSPRDRSIEKIRLEKERKNELKIIRYIFKELIEKSKKTDLSNLTLQIYNDINTNLSRDEFILITKRIISSNIRLNIDKIPLEYTKSYTPLGELRSKIRIISP